MIFSQNICTNSAMALQKQQNERGSVQIRQWYHYL